MPLSTALPQREILLSCKCSNQIISARVAFHIEISRQICSANQMTSFYVENFVFCELQRAICQMILSLVLFYKDIHYKANTTLNLFFP